MKDLFESLIINILSFLNIIEIIKIKLLNNKFLIIINKEEFNNIILERDYKINKVQTSKEIYKTLFFKKEFDNLIKHLNKDSINYYNKYDEIWNIYAYNEQLFYFILKNNKKCNHLIYFLLQLLINYYEDIEKDKLINKIYITIKNDYRILKNINKNEIYKIKDDKDIRIFILDYKLITFINNIKLLDYDSNETKANNICWIINNDNDLFKYFIENINNNIDNNSIDNNSIDNNIIPFLLNNLLSYSNRISLHGLNKDEISYIYTVLKNNNKLSDNNKRI